jgi:hypothetical protein
VGPREAGDDIVRAAEAPNDPDEPAADRNSAREVELLTRWLEPDPDSASKAAYRIAGYGVQVWALAGYLRDERGPTRAYLSEAAQAFRVPREAVEAALAFYRRHRAVIDDRFDASAA